MRLPARIARRVRGEVYDGLVRARIVRYRRPWPLAAQDWDRDYASGKLDHYGGLSEQARYGALSGYVRAWGETPTVLDVGCGTAILRERLGFPAGGYVGIDPSPAAITAARARYPDDHFAVADRPDPGMVGFDVIVCNEMLYYVPQPDALLRDLKIALNRGGWLLTSILRHPGDIALRRAVEAHFRQIDAIEVRSETGRRAWRIVCSVARTD